MYQLRLFGFGLDTGNMDLYYEQPFTLTRQDRHQIIHWIETQAPILFAAGINIPYEIWVCVGATPVRLHEKGVIRGNA